MPRDVWVLTVIAFLVSVGFGVMIPVLPEFARSFGATNFLVGLIVSAFAFMRLATNPFCARINSALGERTALGLGMFVVAASTGAAGLAQAYWQLLVLRGLGGIGSAMFTVAAMTILLRSAPAPLRGRASALYSGGFLLGGMAGPAIGGLLATISITAPFFFYAASLTASGIVGLAMLTPPPPRDAASGVQRPPWFDFDLFRTLLRVPAFRTASLTNLGMGWQSFGVRTSLVPIIVVEILGLTSASTGVAFAIAAVVQGILLGPAGRLVDTRGRRPVLITGTALCALTTLATPFAPTFWVLVVVLCGYGAGSAMVSTASTALVGDISPTSNSTPVALFQMSSDLGSIIGPLIAGALADVISMQAAFAIGAVLLGLGCASAVRTPETLGRSESEVAP